MPLTKVNFRPGVNRENTRYTTEGAAAAKRRLYRLVFSDGRTYIGITKLPLNERMHRHKYLAKAGAGKIFVAWREAGPPVVELLAVVSESVWAETERKAIEIMRPELNVCPGGRGEGRTVSAETRSKMSAAAKGKKKSAETLAKMSAAQQGKLISTAQRDAISNRHKGKKISAGHVEAIRSAHKGKVTSAETRAKISAALRRRYALKAVLLC